LSDTVQSRVVEVFGQKTQAVNLLELPVVFGDYMLLHQLHFYQKK
jgi:hypothetical protein